MKNLRWAISGFLLGLVVALAPSCGPATGNCSASNCAGCCNAAGKCELGTGTTACGLNASVCAVCGPADQCQGGFCRPITGSQKDAGPGDGGADGGADAGTCNAATCPSGCCNANGQCVQQNFQDNLQCGSGGAACGSCSGAFVCNKVSGTTGGSCQDPSCNGCVLGGQCVPGTSTTACGTNGVACTACQSGQTCVNGLCQGGTSCGPGNCNGCCAPNGQCLVGTSFTNCGQGGQACTVCNGSESCVQSGAGGVCQGTTGNGTYGSACNSAVDCGGVGAGAVCKKTTQQGNASYTGGYCTAACGTNPAGCGTGSTCINLAPYGEEAICADDCSTSDPCRATGYACYPLMSGSSNGVCWISPLPSMDAGQPPPANLIGSACSLDTTCQNGGAYPDGFCFTATGADGGPTGWTNGYCSGDCSVAPAIQCGSTGICLGFQSGTQQFSLCMDLCNSGGVGQSNCRTGYVCDKYGLPDGGSSVDGYCWPSCKNAGSGCPSGQICNAQGYCQ